MKWLFDSPFGSVGKDANGLHPNTQMKRIHCFRMSTAALLPPLLSCLAVISLADPATPAPPSPVDAARAGLAKASAESGAAKQSLDAKVAAAKAESDKASAAKELADRLAAESASAANSAAKAAADKAAADKIAADKAAASKSAADAATAAKTAADKAAAEKTAAEQAYSKAQTAERTAAESVLAEEAFAAVDGLEKARAAKAEAEKVVAAKEPEIQKAAAAVSAAKAAEEKAVTEKSGATLALVEATKTAVAAHAAAVAARDAAAATIAQKTAEIPALLDANAATQASLIGGLKPLSGKAWDFAKARHLLWRAGFGGSVEEVTKLHAMGLHAAVDFLVDFQKLPEPAISVDVRQPETETPFEHRLVESERFKLGNERTSRRFQQQENLRKWWLQRMAESQRPLEEKLTLLWHGHFAVNFTKNENPHIMYRQNRLFRDFAAGNFGGLLRGIAQDPAMIAYLDNQANFKGAGNENLGREILELFSMGEGQGYSEQDLREASRALTGYSYEHATGQFKFIATRHDETPKTIFGRSGNWGGDDLVDMILQQPATARFVAGKIFRFFVHDNPSAAMLDQIAGTLRTCRYDIAPVLRNLFLSEEFYSPAAAVAHIKSPAELMAGAIRTLGLKDVNYAALDNAMVEMGQKLFEPPSVKGWDGGRDWINTSRLLTRYNALAALVDQSTANLAALLEARGIQQTEAAVDWLARGLMLLPLNEAKRAELIRFLGPLPPPAEWATQRDQINARLRAAAAALLSTPEFQVS